MAKRISLGAALAAAAASVMLALVMTGCASSAPVGGGEAGGKTAVAEVDESSLVPPANPNWTVHKWVMDSTPTQLEYTEEADGVIKCTVSGGKAIQYAAQLWYFYDVEPDNRYVIKYRAWTESGVRTPYFVYTVDEDVKDVYYPQRDKLKMTTEPKVFTVVTPGFVIGGRVSFLVAQEMGTFYVQMLSIEPLR